MLIVLDKDDTITVPKSGGVCPNTPDDQFVLPNVREVLLKLHAEGHIITIFSNQGGVGMGELSEMQAWEVIITLNAMLGGIVTDTKLAFYHPDGIHRDRYIDKRKPRPEAILELITDHAPMSPDGQIQAIMVGNQYSDQDAARNAGISFKWTHDLFQWDMRYLEKTEGSHAGWFWNRDVMFQCPEICDCLVAILTP